VILMSMGMNACEPAKREIVPVGRETIYGRQRTPGG
jgi:hypothetical protein